MRDCEPGLATCLCQGVTDLTAEGVGIGLGERRVPVAVQTELVAAARDLRLGVSFEIKKGSRILDEDLL